MVRTPGELRGSLSDASISYEKSQRIHASMVYPLLSPNGSAVIVCGHQQGLSILWKGGRPFKSQRTASESRPVNGVSNDMIMVIDSEDEAPENDYKDATIFEEEESELKPSQPQDPIIQSLDLPLGIAVLRLSFPHLPPESQDSTMRSLPKILSDRILIAMTCSDFTIRLLTVPLLPPSPTRKMRAGSECRVLKETSAPGYFGEQMVVLPAENGHQSIPKGVSITITGSPQQDYENESIGAENTGDTQAPGGSNTTSQVHSKFLPERTSNMWHFLIASHSADLSGLLLIHRIAVTADGAKLNNNPALHHIPWQIQYLPSPAISISFNSSLYPAPRHSQLLIAEATGSVRVFDCFSQHNQGLEGSWLVALYPPFQTSSDSTSTISRKLIIAAEWCLAGKAVIVLLCDGEWGLWDLGNVGPKSKNELKVHEGISGRLVTAFTLSGWANSLNASKYPVNKSSTTSQKSRGLVPMTPGARKSRQENLFAGPTNLLTGLLPGGLSVSSICKASIDKAEDESILIWHGSSIVILDSLVAYWQNAVRGAGNLFGNDTRGQLKRMSSPSLGGEVWNHLSILSKSYPYGARSTSSNQKEILITGERKITIVAFPVAESSVQALSVQSEIPSSADQNLLAIGELGVTGMDRILSRMSNGPRRGV